MALWGTSREIMITVGDLDEQGPNAIFFLVVMEPELPEGLCKLSWSQPHVILVLRPRECNSILKSRVVLKPL